MYGAVFGKWDDDSEKYAKQLENIIKRKATMPLLRRALSILVTSEDVELKTGRKQRWKAGLVRTVMEHEADPAKVAKLLQDQPAPPSRPRVGQHHRKHVHAECSCPQAKNLDGYGWSDDEDKDESDSFDFMLPPFW